MKLEFADAIITSGENIGLTLLQEGMENGTVFRSIGVISHFDHPEIKVTSIIGNIVIFYNYNGFSSQSLFIEVTNHLVVYSSSETLNKMIKYNINHIY